jgi:hypothetical protein
MRGCMIRPAVMLWLGAFAIVVVGQAQLAAKVLGGWDGLNDAQPVVAGRHPLHQYHGRLGADTFARKSATACYDPYFQAGYPKTPVFDSGCRPAEFVFGFGSASDDARAYKWGLFALGLAVPFAFALSARGAWLPAPGCVLAAVLGCEVWWSPPARAVFDSGGVDLLAAGLCGVVFAGWLARYHAQPGPRAWCVLALMALLGWYAHPVVWLGLAPVVAIYYFAIGPQHGLAWHLGLFGVTASGVGPNMWWLWDWGKFWWIRQPAVQDVAPLPTWGAVLGSRADNAGLVGDSLFGWPEVVLGAAGVFFWMGTRHRCAAGAFTLMALLAALVARLGQLAPSFIAAGADRAAPLVPALAAVPAAGLLAAGLRHSVVGRIVLFAAAFLPLLAAEREHIAQYAGLHLQPIAKGLSADREQLRDAILKYTTPSARILLEDPTRTEPGWNWTALLPHLTGRSYLGGLDPDACFEHAYCGQTAGTLAGRRWERWTDADLNAYCRRYNVGWVLCRSDTAAARWRLHPNAVELGRFQDGGPVVLFEIQRDRSYILAGQATIARADNKKVVIENLIPEDAPDPNGGPNPVKVVTLSLHHQDGLRVTPNIVHLDRDPDPYDPIPMVRLRMPGPMSRVVLSYGP